MLGRRHVFPKTQWTTKSRVHRVSQVSATANEIREVVLSGAAVSPSLPLGCSGKPLPPARLRQCSCSLPLGCSGEASPSRVRWIACLTWSAAFAAPPSMSTRRVAWHAPSSMPEMRTGAVAPGPVVDRAASAARDGRVPLSPPPPPSSTSRRDTRRAPADRDTVREAPCCSISLLAADRPSEDWGAAGAPFGSPPPQRRLSGTSRGSLVQRLCHFAGVANPAAVLGDLSPSHPLHTRRCHLLPSEICDCAFAPRVDPPPSKTSLWYLTGLSCATSLPFCRGCNPCRSAR